MMDLASLSDRVALTDLADRYLRALDEKSFDQARAHLVFTDDVSLSFPPGDHQGILGVAAFTSGFMGHWARTHHNVSHYQVELDGDKATIGWNVIAVHVHQGSPPPPASSAHFYLGGRFDGTAVRTSYGWRLDRLALRVVWTSGPGIQSIASTMTGMHETGTLVRRLIKTAALVRLRWSWRMAGTNHNGKKGR